MNVTEYLFQEYRSLTTSYVDVSKRLRELLPTFSNEDEIQDALQKIRNIKHMLVGIL